MNNRFNALLVLVSSLVLTMMSASPSLGLTYSELSSSMSGGFGNQSDYDLIFAGIWSIGMILSLYWASRVSKTKRQQQINEAFERAQARKNRNMAAASAPRMQRKIPGQLSKHRSA